MLTAANPSLMAEEIIVLFSFFFFSSNVHDLISFFLPLSFSVYVVSAFCVLTPH